MRTSAIVRGFLLPLVAIVMFSALGCQAIRKMYAEPAPEGAVAETYSIRLLGYEQTVTLKTNPREFIDYMRDIDNIMPPWTKTGTVSLGKDGLPILGETLPFSVNKFGVEVEGQFIVVKAEWDKSWYLWDNPLMLMIHRWEFKTVKDGLRLTFKLVTEVPYGGRLPGMEEMLDLMAKDVFGDIDLVMARIQAHFDPSLDPEELVEVGFRGEIYEAFLQASEARVWIDASPEEVDAWINKPENLPLLMPELKMDERAISLYLQSPRGVVVYGPATLRSGVLRAKTDLFVLEREKDKGYVIRMYMVTLGSIGLVETELKPEKGGTLLKLKMLAEIPAFVSPDSGALMIFFSRYHQLMQERALLIKAGVEGTG